MNCYIEPVRRLIDPKAAGATAEAPRWKPRIFALEGVDKGAEDLPRTAWGRNPVRSPLLALSEIHPAITELPIERFHDGDVGHRTVRHGSVPVLLTRRNQTTSPDGISSTGSPSVARAPCPRKGKFDRLCLGQGGTEGHRVGC
jgi:hypothetical protein